MPVVLSVTRIWVWWVEFDGFFLGGGVVKMRTDLAVAVYWSLLILFFPSYQFKFGWNMLGPLGIHIAKLFARFSCTNKYSGTAWVISKSSKTKF